MAYKIEPPAALHALQNALLAWYGENGRDFPWRSTSDPYRLLVAEKLLQKTGRHTVVDIYERLITRYPTPAALSRAEVGELRALIAPLGFLHRADQLIRMAAMLVTRHDGEVPQTLAALLALPGIGDFIARAVLSICFGQDYPIVDTNVARFLYRIYGLPGKPPSNPARHRMLLDVATQMLPLGHARDYNLALLDLCALICTARNPACDSCPVRQWCDYGSGKPVAPTLSPGAAT